MGNTSLVWPDNMPQIERQLKRSLKLPTGTSSFDQAADFGLTFNGSIRHTRNVIPGIKASGGFKTDLRYQRFPDRAIREGKAPSPFAKASLGNCNPETIFEVSLETTFRVTDTFTLTTGISASHSTITGSGLKTEIRAEGRLYSDCFWEAKIETTTNAGSSIGGGIRVDF